VPGWLAPTITSRYWAELADVPRSAASSADMLRVLGVRLADGSSGTPFRLARAFVDGVREIDTDWLSRRWGGRRPRRSTTSDDRTPNPTLIIISGSVARIEALQCEFATHAEERGLWPVPGTEKVENVGLCGALGTG